MKYISTQITPTLLKTSYLSLAEFNDNEISNGINFFKFQSQGINSCNIVILEMIRRSKEIFDIVGNETQSVLSKKCGGLESFYLSIFFHQKNKVINSSHGKENFLYLLNCDEPDEEIDTFLLNTPVSLSYLMNIL